MEMVLDCCAVTIKDRAATDVIMHSNLSNTCITSAFRPKGLIAAVVPPPEAPTRGPLMVPLILSAATFDSGSCTATSAAGASFCPFIIMVLSFFLWVFLLLFYLISCRVFEFFSMCNTKEAVRQ